MMELDERGFGETGDHAVCLECILDEGLRRQVGYHLTEPACTFCGRKSEDGTSVAASFKALMEPVMDAIRFFYERSIDSLFTEDDFTPRYSSDEVADDVCTGAVSEDVLEAIKEVINEDEWNEDPGPLPPDVALIHAWIKFVDKVKHQTRFVFLSLPEKHSDHPDDFTTTETLQKLTKIIKSRGVLAEIPAGHIFYRGRLADKPGQFAHDAASLGSPPLMKASANRLSPAGISMFYGCDDIATVVAEIGSHTSKRYAVVGEFETTRSLRIVNLAALPEASVFDPDEREAYYDLSFLYDFARDLSAPVVLDGSEHIEYVPTQVVTEYLRWVPHFPIDGILYRSAQNGGTCCVIFCGPEGCANEEKVTDKTMLRLRDGSAKAVRVVASAAES